MSSTPSSRAGKALLKYFKPIRVATAHSTEVKEPIFAGPNAQTTIETLLGPAGRRPKRPSPEEGRHAGVNAPAEEPDEVLPEGESPPAQWIEVVLGLLRACRRASSKMRRAIGMEAYRKAHVHGGARRLQAVGTIVDTTPTMKSDPGDDEKRSA